MIYKGIEAGLINQDTTIIASSSGNLAVAVASICKLLQLKFIPVIDPNINTDNERLLTLLSYRVVKVQERDETGGYLLTRIATVERMHAEIPGSFIADQYGDPNNYKGYYGLADEILEALPQPDHVFVAVSSSGAITGLSSRIKPVRPETKIIGVDIEGSVIFQSQAKSRYISGIGASRVPPIIANAYIDDVVMVSHMELIAGCKALLQEQAIFAGASSGAVYYAAKAYLEVTGSSGTAVMIFPDKGYTYMSTIYNDAWVEALADKLAAAEPASI
ncbi:pyridoxal-phosphate dependent enzyme [Chitinophaga sp. MD30]|uniref:pyridoxal-phosphate dependent enzyme n=1 Tax=Chitinophaga sp. MD30 TaxID=2033437 RepID=UPI000BAF9077|nr:2,3-diaminopropionate biosynthesis protein SbnA [Chitinophaga sp. MD30]